MTLAEIMEDRKCNKKELVAEKENYKIYIIYPEKMHETGSYGLPKFVIDYGNNARMCFGWEILKIMKQYGHSIKYLNE